MYRIFSIKRPRRLFQNWLCAPGVYLKLAFNRGPAFIYELQLSAFFFQINLLSPILRDLVQFVNAERVFPLYRHGKLSLSLWGRLLPKSTALYTALESCNQDMRQTDLFALRISKKQEQVWVQSFKFRIHV